MENAGLYSFRALADKAELGTTTVTSLVYGRRQSDEQTVQAVADALRLKVTTIRSWASQALGQEAPFELPPEANQLNQRQRQAILTVVRTMLDPAGQVDATTGSGKTENAIGQVVDLARPALPDLSRVAARRGHSEGKRRRSEQDSDAADPQD